MKKRSIVILLTVFLIVIALTAVASADSSDRTPADVYWFWQPPDDPDPVGSAKIIRTDSGISGNVNTSLANDYNDYQSVALTMWIVVFNEPSECAGIPCGEPDLFVEDVHADVLYGGGQIIGGTQNANLAFALQAGDNSGSISYIADFLPLDENGESYGLVDPRTAEIHYVLRSHGPNVPGNTMEMIQTFPGGCDVDYYPPADDTDLHTDVGDCQDVQYAINLAP